jgi:hypothetical protein
VREIGGPEPEKTGNPDMSESVFDGRMLGLSGEVVTYPQWFFAILIGAQRRLNKIAKDERQAAVKIIKRDKSTGFWRVLPEVKNQLGALLEIPSYNPRKTVRAFNPAFNSGRPRHCGRRGLIDLLESGIDTARQDIAQCEADLENTRFSKVRVNQIVTEVKKRRTK